VTERGDKGVIHIKELTDGIGADAVLECVGSREPMMQPISSNPPSRVGGLSATHTTSRRRARSQER
jgi:threonine dehydrogenase-like Zn-dependent dehydrogenase